MKQPIQLVPGQHVHFVGIGGAGLSAIARIMLLQGYMVSGSDQRGNEETARLKKDGATIFRGHDAAYVNGAELVITSSAIKPDHIELLSAKAQGIPTYKRYDMMSALMQGYVGIAVAGTHGKTTTTSMTIHILKQSGNDPTYIVGGVMSNTGNNADLGSGRAFVIEADEYDNMFHGLRPQVEIVTSVEFDHPDFFKSPNQMVESFSHFIGLLPDDGLLIACADDPTALLFARNRQVVRMPVSLYGFGESAEWRASNIRYEGEKTLFDVHYLDELQGQVSLLVPGKHNVLNAMAAIIASMHEGLTFRQAAAALQSFRGTGRRFDLREDVKNIAVIDDYAHHPSAIKTTIDAARQRYPDRALWAVWQPHTFSRTRQLWDDYLHAFIDADHVVVTDIYAAREALDPAVTSEAFVQELSHGSKFHAPDLDKATEILLDHVKSPAVILIMSAGDAPNIGINYLSRLRR